MADAWLDFTGDFIVSASGGLLMADGVDLSNQRIVRRLCTAVQGYIWHLDYGAGLPQRIGRPGDVTRIAAIVRAQIALEATVAASPSPTISVDEDPNDLGGFYITINYTEAATGEPVTLSFTP
jgi:hypothetical protein